MADVPSAFHVDRLALAAELRRLRGIAGMTTRAMADALGVGQSTIVNIEMGHRGVKPANVAAWARAAGLDANQAAALADQAQRVATEVADARRAMRSRGPKGMADIQREWAALEEAAPIMRDYTPLIIPGLLQTAEYARRVFAAWPEEGQDVGAAVAARLDRQTALYDGGRRFQFVVHEAALHGAGPLLVRAAQIDRIRQTMTLPSVSLGILPMGAETDIWRYHGFVILDSEADDGPAAVYVELLDQNVSTTDPERVERYRRAFRELQAVAAHGTDAAAILDRLSRDASP